MFNCFQSAQKKKENGGSFSDNYYLCRFRSQASVLVRQKMRSHTFQYSNDSKRNCKTRLAF